MTKKTAVCCFSVLFLCVFTVFLHAQQNVSTHDELSNAITGSAETVINVTTDIDLTGVISAASGVNKTIQSAAAATKTFKGTGMTSYINMNGASLTFNNINFSDSNGTMGYLFRLGNAASLNFSSDVTFSNNSGNGGGINSLTNSVINFAGKAEFNGNTATYNGAAGNGGVFNASATTLTFQDEAVFNGNLSSGAGGGRGGAGYFAAASTINFNNKLTAQSNSALNRGGVFAVDSSVMNFTGDAQFISNSVTASGSGGGALYLNNSALDFTGGAAFQENTSVSMGGAVYMDNAQGKNTSITFNSATVFQQNSSALGGAIYANAGNFFDRAELQASFNGDTLFYNNTATTEGGALHLTLSTFNFGGNVIFSSNTANTGGAVVGLMSDMNFTQEALFQANTATSEGGAVHLISSDLVFDGKTSFVNNKTTNIDGLGGAVFMYDSYIDFNDTVQFSGNESVDGGAIYLEEGSVRFSNALFLNNKATTGSGGAIHASGTSSVISELWFSAVNNGPDDNKIVFQGNTANGVSNAIYLGDYSSAIFNTASGASVEMYDGIVTSANNTNFTVTGAGDFNLYADSNIDTFNMQGGNFNLRSGKTLNVRNFTTDGSSVFNLRGNASNVLNVTNNFVLNGKLEIDGNANGNIVTNNATLNSGSSVDIATDITDTNYREKYYKILKYNVLNGTFGDVTLNDGETLASLSDSYDLLYDDSDWVTLRLYGSANSTGFMSIPGLSRNAKNIARVFDTASGAGGISADLDQMITELDSLLTAKLKRDGLLQISGYFLANVIRSGGMGSDHVEVYDRIKYHDFEADNLNGAWVQFRGQYGKLSSNDNSPDDYKDTGIGFIAGWDKMFDDLGILAGAYGKYNSQSIEQGSKNTADVQGFGAGVYSGYIRDEWELKGLLSFNSDSFDTERRIAYADRTAKADFNGFTIGFDVEGAVKTYVTESIYLKPFVGMEIKNMSYGSFDESGAGDLSLEVESDSYTRSFARFGIGAASDNDALFEWYANIEGKYLLLGEEPEISARLKGDSAKFTTRGAKEGTTLLGVGGGVAYRVIENLKLFANLSFHTSDSYQNLYGNLGVRYMFLKR